MFQISRREQELPAWDNFFNRFFENYAPLASREDFGRLAVDVSELDNKVVVKTSLPGFSKNEVDIQLHDGVLTIKANYSKDKEVKNEKFYQRERAFGSVSRSVTLPAAVDEKRTEANLDNGVLTIVMPKSEVGNPRKIALK